jgi:hypothetical protein
MKNRFFILSLFGLFFGWSIVASEPQNEKCYLVVFDYPVKLQDTVLTKNMGRFDRDITCQTKLKKMQSLHQKNNIIVDMSSDDQNYYLCNLTKNYVTPNINTYDQLTSHFTSKSLTLYPFPELYLKEHNKWKESVELFLNEKDTMKTTLEIKVHPILDPQNKCKKTSFLMNKKLLLPVICIAAALGYCLWVYKYGANQWLLFYNR